MWEGAQILTELLARNDVSMLFILSTTDSSWDSIPAPFAFEHPTPTFPWAGRPNEGQDYCIARLCRVELAGHVAPHCVSSHPHILVLCYRYLLHLHMPTCFSACLLFLSCSCSCLLSLPWPSLLSCNCMFPFRTYIHLLLLIDSTTLHHMNNYILATLLHGVDNVGISRFSRRLLHICSFLLWTLSFYILYTHSCIASQ